MGDTLRNELGIAGKWTKKEIKEYIKGAKEELGPVYMIEDIPLEDPWNRARYLDEKLRIGDKDLRESTILECAKKYGNAYALVTLEEMIISRYFRRD